MAASASVSAAAALPSTGAAVRAPNQQPEEFHMVDQGEVDWLSDENASSSIPDPHQKVLEFLESLGLSHYRDRFIQRGWTDMETLLCIEPQHIARLQLEDGDTVRLQRGLAEQRQRQQQQRQQQQQQQQQQQLDSEPASDVASASVQSQPWLWNVFDQFSDTQAGRGEASPQRPTPAQQWPNKYTVSAALFLATACLISGFWKDSKAGRRSGLVEQVFQHSSTVTYSIDRADPSTLINVKISELKRMF